MRENLPRCRTLIVDDNASSRFALQRIVEHLGHDVTTAEGVWEAIEKLPGCQRVLLDLHLPDGYGTTVLRHVREERLSVLVAILSATSDGELWEKTRQLGPDIMFHKPADITALERWLLSA